MLGILGLISNSLQISRNLKKKKVQLSTPSILLHRPTTKNIKPMNNQISIFSIIYLQSIYNGQDIILNYKQLI